GHSPNNGVEKPASIQSNTAFRTSPNHGVASTDPSLGHAPNHGFEVDTNTHLGHSPNNGVEKPASIQSNTAFRTSPNDGVASTDPCFGHPEKRR
ncbi:MAG TPA: hypothetical protein VFG38_21260, partial [Pseudomonadales bacterium]|nr:hypothetical protein [Pseudomonadales bacterium]